MDKEKNTATATSSVSDENIGTLPNSFESNQETPQVLDKTNKHLHLPDNRSASRQFVPLLFGISGVGMLLAVGGAWWLVKKIRGTIPGK